MLCLKSLARRINRQHLDELHRFQMIWTCKHITYYIPCNATRSLYKGAPSHTSYASFSQYNYQTVMVGTKRELLKTKHLNNYKKHNLHTSNSLYGSSINTFSKYTNRSLSNNTSKQNITQTCQVNTTTHDKTHNNENEKGSLALLNKKGGESHLDNEELHFDRNFITAMRAMKEFLLKPEHLVGLRVTSRRSAKDNDVPLNVYWRKDVEAKSVVIWGSLDAMEKEKEKRDTQALDQQEFKAIYKRYFTKSEERKKLNRKSWPVRALRPTAEEDGLNSQSGKVVLWAIGINGGNTFLKFVAWLATGSHAMFSEFIHSVADTLNQIILAYGIKSSAKKADENHPYGYTNMQYVSSLISGVGIFCLGSGLSVYHGIDGLISPQSIESLTVAFTILGISFISESVTLALAIKSIRQSAILENMGFVEYIVRGYDPCVNVVLLEDTAAVMGVVIAAGSMALSVQYGSHIPDALGSIAIGGLLGAVATFMITTNSNLLVGMNEDSSYFHTFK